MAETTRSELNPAARRTRGRWLIGGAVLGVVVLVGGGYWFFTQGPGWAVVSPRGATVAEFRGDGNETTESFRIREGWRISWETTGDRFAFAVRGDRNLGTVVNVKEPSNGITTPPSRGTFYIEITADGGWTITILQGR